MENRKDMIVNLSEVINTILLNNLGNCLKGEKILFKVVKTTLWWNISTHVFADTYHFLKRCRVFFLFLKKAKECVILKAGLSTTNIVAYYYHKKIKFLRAYVFTHELHLLLPNGWLTITPLKRNYNFIVFRKPIFF